MRTILNSEKRKEICNAAALGIMNAGIALEQNTQAEKTQRERKIVKTKAGFALMEKASNEDIKNHPNITYVKDEKGDSWILVKSSKNKKDLT